MRALSLAVLVSLATTVLSFEAAGQDAGAGDFEESSADGGVGDDWGLDPGDFPMADAAGYETTVIGQPPAEEGLSRKRIGRDELRRRGSATAAEAVEHEPAVFASSGKKGERTFRLRGFDQRGVAVYLDGVPFTMPYGGSVDLGKIPAQMLDAILLIKGPTSVVHGPGGMGGALTLETRDPADSPLIDAEVGFSDDAEVRATLFHACDPGPFSYALGVGGAVSDGYSLSSQFTPTEYEDGAELANSDRSIRHAAGKLVVPMPGPNEFIAQAFVVDGEFGIPRSTTDTRPFFSRFTVWRAAVGQVAHRLDAGDTAVEEAFYVAAFDNQLDSYDDATFSTQDGPNAYSSFYHDRTFGGRINARRTFRGLPGGATHVRLWLGAQHDIHLARLQSEDDQEEFSRTLFTVVPELEIPIVRGLVAIASAQADIETTHNEGALIEGFDGALEDETTAVFGPLASLRWDPIEVLMVRLSVARRNRIPTLSERYSSRLGFTVANPGLDPESAWHVGLDVNWDILRNLGIEMSAFDAEVTDLIHSQYVPETNGVTQKRNVGRARLAGVEAALSFTPVRQLELTAAYAYLYARRLDPTEDEDRIAQIPAHQGVFGALARPAEWISLSTYLRVIGPQAFDDYNILGLGELGTYAVLDARVEVEPRPGFSLFLQGSNLLDMNYQTKYGYPDRGMNFWVGARAKID